MRDFLESLAGASDFMPHGNCLVWNPEVLWLHVGSDVLTGLAYYLIAGLLFYLVAKRRDLPFFWMIFMFGAFIFACGTTHFMAAWTIYVPSYRLEGAMKMGTAVISIATAMLLALRFPRLLKFPSLGNALNENRQLDQKLSAQISILEEAKGQLKRNNALLVSLIDSIPDLIFYKDPDSVYLGCNKEFTLFLGHSKEEIIGRTDLEFFPKDLAEFFREKDRQMLSGGVPRRNEEWVEYPDGRRVLLDTLKTPYFDPDNKLLGLIGISRDITEYKGADEERQAHLHFLESLERVDQTIKQATDVEQLLWNVMQTVYSIFDCDRGWLLYPCDPETPSFRVPVEVSRPEYPGAKALNTEVPLGAGQAQEMREALASDGPVTYVAGTERPVSKGSAEQFGVQSQIFKAIYPKVGKPWAFGMHQCSYPRIWTGEEKKLFNEIGRRIADGLSSVLYLRELKENEARYQELFDHMGDGVAVYQGVDGGHDFVFVDMNKTGEDLLRTQREEVVGQRVTQVFPAVERIGLLDVFRRVWQTGQPEQHPLTEYADERITLWVENYVYKLPSGLLVALYSDTTEKRRAEAALAQAAREWSVAMDASDDVIYLLDLKRRIVRANKTFYLTTGTTPEFAIGRHIVEVVHPQGEATPCPVCLAQEEKRDFQVIMEADHSDNPVGRPLEITVKIIRDQEERPLSILMTLHDLSAARKEMEEKAILEGQLQQAQKMESVGRLAGGVAHDFNNMLGVILGHAEMALMRVDPAQPMHADLIEILKAGKRSADLTRQLLAFARRQTVTPEVLDLNEVGAGMLKMLQRLLGEGIQLNWQPAADLWPIRVDPSQIDQILVNLCVNARDAIADVGRITIETGNRSFDEEYCAGHAGFAPGEYVRLTVSDDSRGMDQEMLAHIFEPFFTTKGVGEGTGLGLATVYGIVRQNNGFVNVYSEPEKGTTFTIYLPRHAGQAERASMESAAEPVLRGHETILLVEDESAILEMTTMMLEMQGYTVLAANTPGEAIRLAGEHVGKIHLLITDVIMPEMNGRDLAKNLLSLYPHLKRLFMSGYTADVIARHGVLDEGVAFIQKPFSRQDLAVKVRKVLESA